ncbi:hypothetical protein IAD21_04968 [Abditibacteriota bacterium]|nr:hypothetical protein IAD21_04968 [Abditibacteriota bacterium]
MGIFEIILTIGAVIAISRMAETDRSEGFKWGAITLGLCVVAFFLPIPFLRIVLAIGLSFGLMTFTKKTFY